MMVLMLRSSRCLNGNFRRKSRLWKPSWLLKVPATLLNRRVLKQSEVRKPKKRRQPKLRNLSKMTSKLTQLLQLWRGNTDGARLR